MHAKMPPRRKGNAASSRARDRDPVLHSVTMRAGEVWLLNNEVIHSVENNSSMPRVHLVFDTAG